MKPVGLGFPPSPSSTPTRIRRSSIIPSLGMMMRFALFELCYRNWWTPLSRQAVSRGCAKRSRWQAFPPNELLTVVPPSGAAVSAEQDMATSIEIDPQLVKQLREKTNAGFMDCKRALAETGGDLEKAETLLRTKGIASASKKSSRATKEGIVASYIHLQGKVGVLVEVNCETDFVAKNEGFRAFVKDITLHIAAAQPLYVSRDEVPQATVAAERDIYAAQVKGKPENVISKIVEGKLDK